MAENVFWGLIERARASGQDTLAENLQSLLEQLEPNDIVAFHDRLWVLMTEAHTDALWAVSYIVNGGSSEDGFCYFRAWLIAQGREKYLASLADPAQAAVSLEPGDIAEYEDLLGCAVDAYSAKTGTEIWDKAAPIPHVEQSNPGWTEEQLPALYPALYQRFSSQ